MVNWVKTWYEVIQDLQNGYGDGAKVAVIPEATVQYFPDASKIHEQRYHR